MPRCTVVALALSSLIVAGPALSTGALHSQSTAAPSACDRDARGYDEDWDTHTDRTLSQPRMPEGSSFGSFANPTLDEPGVHRPPRRDPTPRRDDPDHCYRWNLPAR